MTKTRCDGKKKEEVEKEEYNYLNNPLSASALDWLASQMLWHTLEPRGALVVLRIQSVDGSLVSTCKSALLFPCLVPFNLLGNLLHLVPHRSLRVHTRRRWRDALQPSVALQPQMRNEGEKGGGEEEAKGEKGRGWKTWGRLCGRQLLP